MALEIRPFTLADVPFGKMLTDAEDWHRAEEDWIRLVHLEPEGAFKAVVDGIPAGTAAVLRFDRVAWIHSMIVLPDFRRKGVGEALMRACMDFVERRKVPTTKLDSVDGVEPFYARLGFRKEYPSWRFLGDRVPGKAPATRLRPKDRSDVFAFDRSMTGLDRAAALAAILRDHPDRAFLARARGKVSGYIIARRGDYRDPLGPWVVDPEKPDSAADLLRSVLTTGTDQKFRMCVGGYNEEALRIAEELGFEKAGHSTRMYRGEPFAESRACYAMISAEKG